LYTYKKTDIFSIFSACGGQEEAKKAEEAEKVFFIYIKFTFCYLKIYP
jgi:hypothetical protein